MSHELLKKGTRTCKPQTAFPQHFIQQVDSLRQEAFCTLNSPRQGVVQGRAPGEIGPCGLDLHIREQRHGKCCLPGAGVGRGALEAAGRKKSDLGRRPILHRARQVTIIQLFMALFRCDNHSLIWARALQSTESCGGGASRGTPDACSQAICLYKPLTSFLGKTLGTLAESSCLNFKLENDPAPLPFSPIPPTSWSCGEAETSAFVMLWVSGSSGLEGPPASNVGNLFPSGCDSTENQKKKKERKNKQHPPFPAPLSVACWTLVSV